MDYQQKYETFGNGVSVYEKCNGGHEIFIKTTPSLMGADNHP